MRSPSRPVLALALAGLVLGGVPVVAADWYVNCEIGSASNDGQTPATPKQNIQETIDLAAYGDTVRVAAGICDQNNQGNLGIVVRPGVAVRGAGSFATFVRNVGAQPDGAVFYVAEEGTSIGINTQITDFDILTATDGVQIWNGTPTVRNNVIRGSGSFPGVGVNVTTFYPRNRRNEANPVIEDNVFRDLDKGVQVLTFDADSSAVVRRNWFLGGAGAAVYHGIYALEGDGSLNLQIVNNIIAGSPAGVQFYAGAATITNNTITATGTGVVLEASDIGQMHNNVVAFNDTGVEETSLVNTPVGSLRNNDFFANASADYIDVLLGSVGDVNVLPGASGNISVDPYFRNPTGGDYHIDPRSGARDAGTLSGAPSDDIDRQTRSDGLRDIGADEANLPQLRVTYHQLTADLCPGMNPPGNNLVADPGEVVDVYFEVTNFATLGGATNVTGTIVPLTPGVQPPIATVNFGSVLPLETVVAMQPYTFFWNSSNCSDDLRFAITLSADETGPTPPRTYSIARFSCLPCTNPIKPTIVYQGTQLNDVCPNGVPPGTTGAIDPGETGELLFTVNNSSPNARASGVTVDVSTTTPGVTPATGRIVLGNVLPGGSLTGPDPFVFQVDPAQVACGQTIVFDLSIDWLENDGPPLTQGYLAQVPTPCVDCTMVSPDLVVVDPPPFVDNCSSRPPNGGIEPGEVVALTITVDNLAPDAGATGVTGTIFSLTPLASPSSRSFTIGAIPPSGQGQAAAVGFRISSGAGCGVPLDFDVELKSDQGGTLPRQRVQLMTAASCVLCTDTPVALSVAANRFSDVCLSGSPPGGSGTINPGEIVELTVDATNASNAQAATGVVASVVAQQAWVSPQVHQLTFPDIAPQATAPSSMPLSFVVDRDPAWCGQSINFAVTFSSNETGAQMPESLVLGVEPPVGGCAVCAQAMPNLTAAPQPLGDRCPYGPPDNDGKVDPGEFVDVVMRVTNSAAVAATDVRAIFRTSYPYATPGQGMVSGPDIAGGASANLPAFSLLIDRDHVPCGTVVPVEVTVISNETGAIPAVNVDVPVAVACQACRPSFQNVLLYRATVVATSPGWKQSIGLPLDSGSPGRDGAPWPMATDSPGSLDDTMVPFGSLILYRLVDRLDNDLGNYVRAGKVVGQPDVRIVY